MTIIINIALVAAAVLLMLPFPLKKTMKLLIPVLVTVATVLCTAFIIYNSQDRLITVTALSEKNASAESDEVWLRSVTVNGSEFDAGSRFSGGWISDGGTLKWRSYDVPDGMGDSVSAVFPRGSKVELIFQTNRWRGKAHVRDGSEIGFVYELDLYADTSDQEVCAKYTELRSFKNISFSEKAKGVILTVGVAVLLLSLSIYVIMARLEKSETESRARRVKKILITGIPLLLILIAVSFAIISAVDNGSQKIVTVTATDQKDPSSEATEIWIKSVVVDGKEYAPEQFFSNGGWKCEDGFLKWNSYDRPEGMSNSVSAYFPAESDVDIFFEANRWRGIAEVKVGNRVSVVYRVNCYDDNSDYTKTVGFLASRETTGLRIDGKLLVLVTFILTVLGAIYIYIYTARTRPSGKGGRE